MSAAARATRATAPTIHDLIQHWPDAKVGMVDVPERSPRQANGNKLPGGKDSWPYIGTGKLPRNMRWGVVPGSLHPFIAFDVDNDHEAAERALVAAFGPPVAKVKSHHKGWHYWYMSDGNEIPSEQWLFGELRGSTGYIVLWRFAETLKQLLEGKGSLRAVSYADIKDAGLLGRPATKSRVDTMLGYVEPDDYGTWIKVGMALQAELGDAGLAKWDAWSKGSDKYTVGKCEEKWRGFDEAGRITLGTLHWLASENGYKASGGRPAAAGGRVPELDRIVRVGAGAETVWELTQGDTIVRMTQADLCNQGRFRTAWHAATGAVVRVKQSEWDKAISDWWRCADVVEAPSMDDVIWTQLEAFCTDSQAMAREELLNGMPFTEGDTTWLRIEDFRLHLASKRVNVAPQRIWSALRAHAEPEQKTIQEKGIRLRVGGVPKFDVQDRDFSVPNPTGGIDF